MNASTNGEHKKISSKSFSGMVHYGAVDIFKEVEMNVTALCYHCYSYIVFCYKLAGGADFRR